MINNYVADIALEMRIHLSQILVVEGQTIGCYDVQLLHLVSGSQRVNTLVYQSELDVLKMGAACDRLDVRIRIALSRLQSLSNLDLLPDNDC